MAIKTTETEQIIVPLAKHDFSVISKYAGPHACIFEAYIYFAFEYLCHGYGLGYWDFYELSNGGFYMSPTNAKQYEIASPNGYRKTVSADAAGIIACIFAYCWMYHKTGDKRFVKLSDNLKYFAAEHVEGAEIYAAID